MMKTAVLIDGAFFLKCFRHAFPDRDHQDAAIVARTAFSVALEHLRRAKRSKDALYRIFFYDCPPIEKKMHLPVSRRSVDFAKSPEARFRRRLHQELRQQRKLALRLGQLSDHVDWELKPDALSLLRRGELRWEALEDANFQLNIKQKAVDMKVGLDIASLAYKRLVDQIVLIAGDADFVPAAKLARREGIDFILNPMGKSISKDLFEHIDGLHSVRLKPIAEQVAAGEPAPQSQTDT
ncbi:NYN domain-containing protein [Marilutibacter maris]|uniref:NYN domain-containing protein n=1 Tax=Marilutibacter maris TaxID=1605891 RepID=A0A2U9TBD2_9GAMM|nr:NYN domain-containing protein [Lysobacter maris]AWV08487.1 hypothetical protein C9I47_2816 [Lysobacter maris]